MRSTKTSAGLVILEINKSLNEISVAHVGKSYAAKIVCPICSDEISVPQSYAKRANENIGKPWWNMSGFNRHLKETHKTYNLEEHCEYCTYLLWHFYTCQILFRCSQSID